MESSNLLLSLLFLLAFLISLFSLVGRIPVMNKNLPPGPRPLPVIGNFLLMGKKPHQSLTELAKIHGPIMSLKLGQLTTVVISSPLLTKEILQKQDLAFSNRFLADAMRTHDHPKYSVVLSPVGDMWRSFRKILNNNLFSATRLDHHKNLRRKKVEELISFVGERCREGAAVDIGCAAFTTSINLLSMTIFSMDLMDLNEESSARDFKDLILNILVETGKPNLVDYFPFLAIVDPQGIRRKTNNYFGAIHGRFGRIVDERLNLRKSATQFSSEKDTIDLFFFLGSDTSSSSVEWMMAELLRNPRVLAKAKAELEEKAGAWNILDETNISCLPYLRAVVQEGLRLHPPVPFLIPRTVETDVEVSGYTVPKGAQILVNAWANGRDPKLWSDPNCFMPERFIESSIDVRGQDFELIPFGAGRRICPGLPMGMRMVMTMLGSLINSFDWKLVGGIVPGELDMEDAFGLTLHKARPLCAVPISKIFIM